MSLLWRDELRVALCPERLIVLRRTRLSGAIKDRRVQPVGQQPSVQLWGPAAASFREFCDTPQAKACDVTAILSNHFVRYAVLPWSRTFRQANEWRTYAEHVFSKTYGRSAADWRVIASPTGHRQPWLACATDRQLMQAITDSAAASGVRPISVQPALLAAFNRVRSRLDDHPAWLIVQEAGRLVLALFSGGAWHKVLARPVDARWTETLSDLLHRESVVAGFERPITRIYLLSEDLIPAGRGALYGRVSDLTIPAAASLDLRACMLALA